MFIHDEVFSADSTWFRYWNEEKNFGNYPFEPPTQMVKLIRVISKIICFDELEIPFAQFLKKAQEATDSNKSSKEYLLHLFKIYLISCEKAIPLYAA